MTEHPEDESLATRLKDLPKSVLATPRGWGLLGLARSPATVVLTYHRVGLSTDPIPGLDIRLFRQQMLWLRERCAVIWPHQLHDAVTHPRLDRLSVLLTFDDGYRGYHDHVYPVLRELGLPALVFLSTAYLDDEHRLFEWDTLRLAIQRTQKRRLRLPWAASEEVAVPEDRRFLHEQCREYLKFIPSPRRQELTTRVLEELEVGVNDLRAPRQVLSWGEVRATLDLTTYGGHTHTHPLMSHLAADELDEEIRVCRDRIAAETGVRPRFFAYPNGDSTPLARELLRRHGFEVAFSTIEGVNRGTIDWWAVRRLGGNGPLPRLVWRISRAAALDKWANR